MEGHGDNVAAALFGGLVVVWDSGRAIHARSLPIAANLRGVVFIPERSSSTRAARAVLPAHVEQGDAVFNIARVALLVDALRLGGGPELREAMRDRLHQPYRLATLPHAPLIEAAVEAGAYGAALSGAGSSLLALCDTSLAPTVAAALAARARDLGVPGETVPLGIDRQGLVITRQG